MNSKTYYPIVVAIVLILLVTPACGSSPEGTPIPPAPQEAEKSEAQATEEVKPEETEQVEQPKLGLDVRMTLTASSSLPQIEAGNFAFEGYQRTYLVFTPKNYTGDTNVPLVIYLHAYNWSPVEGMNYTTLRDVAEANGFLVVYAGGAENWNSGIGDNLNYPTSDVNDVGFINALIDKLSDQYSIDPARIYATGFGNGGMMAYKLACQLSDRIAAIAAVVALFPNSTAEECDPARPVPVLHIHGTEYWGAPIEGTDDWYSADETIKFWTDHNNCLESHTTMLQDLDPQDGCTVEKTSYSNCSNNSNVIYYKVINGGGTWPGAHPYDSLGTTNRDIDAGVEIWNFFKEYQLP